MLATVIERSIICYSCTQTCIARDSGTRVDILNIYIVRTETTDSLAALNLPSLFIEG